MEDLLEDEDEDFDKDDKVIMSCVRVVVTCAHTHGRPPDADATPPHRLICQSFLLPEAQTHLPRLRNLLTFWKFSL